MDHPQERRSALISGSLQSLLQRACRLLLLGRLAERGLRCLALVFVSLLATLALDAIFAFRTDGLIMLDGLFIGLCAGALVLIPALAEWIQADRLEASEKTRAEEAERAMADAAHKLEAEIARSDPDAATAERPIQLFRIPISAIYEIGSGPSDGFSLQNIDAVFIRSNPDFEPQQYVEIKGQIRFPGTYALKSRSERLTEIIERAGTLKKDAYLDGIKFTRASAGSIAVDLKAALKNPDGLTGAKLARKLGVSTATISLIRSGHRWAHLQDDAA